MNTHPTAPWWLWVVLLAVLFAQGSFLFGHARRHGRFPWIWGLWGFVSFPLPTIVYVLYYAWTGKRNGGHDKSGGEAP
ncbi:sigmaY antisigma factor component [Paenibacillus thermoaerophilus]|uniref:SigmaY antisigma factor component n=1 Tax=Paenibacillus thermoaerophilus TaxID=1215385 RepID=A0ABW2V1R4_9BACL|nr:sigmaY antisigma factor component [Paenibacillus thermoaerophilus]TMV19102.1 sigmaY antisigma factor component [Paenibacillus thermoaerophilus]